MRTIPWYIILLMFKKLPQTFARRQKGGVMIFSDKPLQQKYIQSFACAEASEYLQLESRPRRGKEDAFEILPRG